MLKPGLCTVTFKNRAIEDVILLTAKAGLDAIECGALSHVETGDLKKAREVKIFCADNGIDIPSYGSYYRTGVSKKKGEVFESVLETAKELGCENIRVWAGDRDFGDADSEFVSEAVEDSLRIAELAKQYHVTISFEFHKESLTDTNVNAIKFANMVKHENIRFYWQPPNGCSYNYCMEGLKALHERLGHIHVFHWTVGSPFENIVNSDRPPIWPDDYYRHNLEDGKQVWIDYLDYADNVDGLRYCFLEFVKDDSGENLIKDALTLTNIINSLVLCKN